MERRSGSSTADQDSPAEPKIQNGAALLVENGKRNSASSMFHERPFIDDTLVLHKLGSSVLDFWFGGAVLINSLAAVAAFHNES